MNFLNSKAQTIKIPCKGAQKFDQEHALDVLLACAYFGVNPVNHAELNSFEHYIRNSPESKICQKVKDTLAELSDEEKRRLFR
jgi:hypothetical protein